MNLRVAIQKVAVGWNIGNQPFQGVGTPRIFVGFLTPEQALDDVPDKYGLESDHYEETAGHNFSGFLITWDYIQMKNQKSSTSEPKSVE